MVDKAALYDLVKSQSLEYDKFEKVHPLQTWKYHLLPVIKNACDLARRFGADTEVAEMAALFHDYAALVDFEKYYKTHHIASGELAQPILLAAGYDQDFIDRVKKCVASHRGSVNISKSSIEEVCLADADAMTHIDNAFEIIMWMGQRGSSIQDGSAFVKKKMTNSFAKLSPQTKELVRPKYEAIMTICY